MNGKSEIDTDFHWWVQAEALVGFLNAYQINKDDIYLSIADDIWEFIRKRIVDHKHGEWFYRIDENHNPSADEYKVSEWKGPYHNSRACLEIIRRINE
ncbi:MAG: AGE family epimerase/isomerase [candidate division KSB1 bacterium]|nr:AGE family epimerase/isomerase [candidate division KSB1 bacterium]